MKKYIGVDMGGTNIKIGIVDENGELIAKEAIPTFVDLGRDAIIANMTKTIRKLLNESSLSVDILGGIGVCCPGPLDPETGIIFDMPNVPGWTNFNLLNAIQAYFPNGKILVDNDANAAALGEWWVGENQQSKNLIFYTLGTGVGGGLILDGKLFHGSSGVAAELGHVTVLPDGPPCGCGNNGCLEVLASGTAIVRQAKEMIHVFPQSILMEKLDALTPEVVYNCAENGDYLAQEILKEVGSYLGIAIGNTLNMLNPDKIVIGGGVAAAHKFFMPSLLSEVEKRAFPAHRQAATIKLSSVGYYAGLIGAAGLIKFA